MPVSGELTSQIFLLSAILMPPLITRQRLLVSASSYLWFWWGPHGSHLSTCRRRWSSHSCTLWSSRGTLGSVGCLHTGLKHQC